MKRNILPPFFYGLILLIGVLSNSCSKTDNLENLENLTVYLPTGQVGYNITSGSYYVEALLRYKRLLGGLSVL